LVLTLHKKAMPHHLLEKYLRPKRSGWWRPSLWQMLSMQSLNIKIWKISHDYRHLYRELWDKSSLAFGAPFIFHYHHSYHHQYKKYYSVFKKPIYYSHYGNGTNTLYYQTFEACTTIVKEPIEFSKQSVQYGTGICSERTLHSCIQKGKFQKTSWYEDLTFQVVPCIFLWTYSKNYLLF